MRDFWVVLVVAIGTFGLGFVLLEPCFSTYDPLFVPVRGLNSRAWLMAILGFGRRYLIKPTLLLRTANEGALPFYMLHQTVIVIIGYLLINVWKMCTRFRVRSQRRCSWGFP